MTLEYKVLDPLELESFEQVRKKVTRPILDDLTQGKIIFVPGEDEGPLNGLYEAARRRNMKFSLKKGQMDGVIGFLAQMKPDEAKNGKD